MWAFISPWAFGDAVLQMHALNAWQSPNVHAHKWGGGGGPPKGEFNGIDSKSQFYSWGTDIFDVLKLDVLKNRVLERSGLDFGASGPRFRRLWASSLADFKEFWDRFFGKKLTRKCFLPADSDSLVPS